jgi:hypothetical protein
MPLLRALSYLGLSVSIFGNPSAAIAALHPSFYFPSDHACAVYQGSIEVQRAFGVWTGANQQLTVTLDRTLTVAVVQQGKIVPAFTVNPNPQNNQQEQIFRLPSTGSPQIIVRGLAQDTTITFCLR